MVYVYVRNHLHTIMESKEIGFFQETSIHELFTQLMLEKVSENGLSTKKQLSSRRGGAMMGLRSINKLNIKGSIQLKIYCAR